MDSAGDLDHFRHPVPARKGRVRPFQNQYFGPWQTGYGLFHDSQAFFQIVNQILRAFGCSWYEWFDDSGHFTQIHPQTFEAGCPQVHQFRTGRHITRGGVGIHRADIANRLRQYYIRLQFSQQFPVAQIQAGVTVFGNRITNGIVNLTRREVGVDARPGENRQIFGGGVIATMRLTH